MDKDVAETSHLAKLQRERGRHPPGAFEHLEERLIGAWFTEPLTRDHVGSDVEGGLYRNLQGVLDKPALANITLDSSGVGEFGELPQAGLDERETLAYQVEVWSTRDTRRTTVLVEIRLEVPVFVSRPHFEANPGRRVGLDDEHGIAQHPVREVGRRMG